MLRKSWLSFLLMCGVLAGYSAFDTICARAQPHLPAMEAWDKQTEPPNASPSVVQSDGKLCKLMKFMNDNEGTWAAIGAIGTISVSILAVYLANAANKQQRQVDVREKKEELRGILDHLIDLREKAGTMPPSVNAQKQNLYLQAAQALQKQIPNELTSADYIVLGEENKAIFFFRRAREFAVKAVVQANSSSAYEKSTALRFLADTYYYYPVSQAESKIEAIKHGRKLYEDSISILEENESDSHVVYTKCFSYIRWAKAEAYNNNLIEAQSNIKEIFQLQRRILDDFHLKIDLILRLSEQCMEIGVKFFNNAIEKSDKSLFQNGHDAFAAAVNALNIAYRILPHFPNAQPQIDCMKAKVLFNRCLHQLRTEHEPNKAYYSEAKDFATPEILQDHNLSYMWKEISSMQEKSRRASPDWPMQIG